MQHRAQLIWEFGRPRCAEMGVDQEELCGSVWRRTEAVLNVTDHALHAATLIKQNCFALFYLRIIGSLLFVCVPPCSFWG